MAVTYGFYNSVNSDRLYDAEQFSRLFQGIIEDGVFSSIGTSLAVVSNAGMNVAVGVGRAWFNNTWTDNDTPLVLPVEASHLTLNRIDTVVLEVNTTEAVRANEFKVIAGEPATNPVAPTLNPPADVYQYPLANLSIPADADTIPQGSITNLVGTAPCPFITGALTTFDSGALVAQWEAEFDAWFEHIMEELSSEAAGNLQNQIDAILAIFLKPTKRRGGDPSDWNIGGNNIYDIGKIKLQIGVKDYVFENSLGVSSTITFGEAFSGNPLVFAFIIKNDAFNEGGVTQGTQVVLKVSDITASTFLLKAQYTSALATTLSIAWIAVGPYI